MHVFSNALSNSINKFVFFCRLNYIMPDTTARYGHLKHLASLLRVAARTLRLFSDTDKVGGNYISDVTKMSLHIEEDAQGLEDLARKEVETQRKSH